MSRLEPSILARRLADEDQAFISIHDAARAVVTSIFSRQTFSALTQAEIDAIAKSFGAPAGATRRKQPSLVQPMQQQASGTPANVREQAMAQSDQQKLPAKGEFGGVCGATLCTCVNARFEYISEEAEHGAFGKFFCAGCAGDKNRQAMSFSSMRHTGQVCVERTVAPPKVEKKVEKAPTDDDRYWNFA